MWNQEKNYLVKLIYNDSLVYLLTQLDGGDCAFIDPQKEAQVMCILEAHLICSYRVMETNGGLFFWFL